MPVKSLRPDDVERFMHDVAAGQDGSQGEDRATRSLDRTRRSWCRRSHKALSISDQEDIWKPAIAATWLMILTGWRRGEVLGLRWSEIDLPPRTARLAVSAKCIAIANSGFSGGAVRSTSGCFGDGGGEEVEIHWAISPTGSHSSGTPDAARARRRSVVRLGPASPPSAPAGPQCARPASQGAQLRQEGRRLS